MTFAVGNNNVSRPGLPGDLRSVLSQNPAIGDKLQKFLDAFDKAAQGSPDLQGMMNGEAMKALREIAKLLSQAKSGQVSPQGMQGQSAPCGAAGQNQAGALAQNGSNFNPAALNAVQNPQQQQALSGGCAGAGGSGSGGCAPSGGSGSSGNPELDALAAGGGGAFFEDRIFAIMCKVVKDMQKQIEQRLNNLQAQAKAAEAQGGAGGGGGQNGQESRNIEFEKIKMDIQKLSQMQQAMSNVLNTMDELAKTAIRQIKV